MLDYCQSSCWNAVNLEPTVARRRSTLAVNYLENYLQKHHKIHLKVIKKTEEKNSPMRLGETGADRGMPNGVLKP